AFEGANVTDAAGGVVPPRCVTFPPQTWAVPFPRHRLFFVSRLCNAKRQVQTHAAARGSCPEHPEAGGMPDDPSTQGNIKDKGGAIRGRTTQARRLAEEALVAERSG